MTDDENADRIASLERDVFQLLQMLSAYGGKEKIKARFNYIKFLENERRFYVDVLNDIGKRLRQKKPINQETIKKILDKKKEKHGVD